MAFHLTKGGTIKVQDILSQIDLGSMALPEFQRGYVWNRDQVIGLMEYLYRGHPVGSLLVWVTSTAVYRGANRKARSAPEPKWRPFSFPAEEEPAPPGPEAVQQSANLAEEAVERIHRTCQDAMDWFSDDRNSHA